MQNTQICELSLNFRKPQMSLSYLTLLSLIWVLNYFEIKVGNEEIKPSPSARNLGFYTESQLKSQAHEECSKDP